MGKADEREHNSDEREVIGDDVEAHGVLDRPVDPAPEAARDDEGDDVEAHYLSESPPND